MAGPNPDSFQRALERFKKSLAQNSPELIDQFSLAGPQDVRRVCLEIQEQQGRDGCLRRMRRMESFIEAMDQLGKSIEVFLNVNELVCFIWGPVKFLLGAARQYLDSFDKLLDVYAKVGEAVPGLMMYQSTFEKHRPLATVLEDYYSDILRFHEAALGVFTRPKWKTAFKSVWKTFDTQFIPILDSLNRRRELLESEKGSATLHEMTKSREEIAAFNDEFRRRANFDRLEKHKWRLAHVKEKLDAPDYQLDQEMAAEDRNGSASGDWLLRNPAFQKWTDRCNREHQVLYVNGIPGAGKTTMVSSIIERLLEEISVEGSSCDTLAVYFYFKHNQGEKRTHNSFLRAMMEQIMTRDPALSDHMFDDLASINGVNLRSTKTLESLVKTSFEHFRTCLIVMDGLDEAAPGEAVKLLKWLLPIADARVHDNQTSMRLLFCGQRDGVLDQELSGQPCITLESVPDHDVDIGNYCAQIGARIRSKFCLPPEMESEIVSQVTKQANGMFLYARVVLENLLSQTRLSRLRQEMEPDTFPDGIERAYERVAVRIFQESPRAEREDATKIMGWLTCAQRLLCWREIQAIFCIHPEASQVDYNGERLRLSCKQLCGSLVDIHRAQNGQDGPDDVIKIVHGTAREYFIRKRWVNLSLEHAKAATFCFRYLTSKPFLRGANDEQTLQYARQGYYAFQDYSVQFCLDHFLKSVESSPPETAEMMLSTSKSARDFLESYSLSIRLQGSDEGFSHKEPIPFIRNLPKNTRDRDQCFDIAYRTVTIRRQIEELRSQALTAEELDIVNNLYGFKTRFKCPRTWCTHFTTGFKTKRERTKHLDCHERPFCCPEESCFASRFGFDAEDKLKQHTTRHHPPQNTEVRFPNKFGKRQVDKGQENSLSLGKAAAIGNVEAVLAFLDSGVDPNSPPEYAVDPGFRARFGRPLELAAAFGHLEVCKKLLERGAKLVEESAETSDITTPPLYTALYRGQVDIISLFLLQPELRSSRVLQKLPGWITAACKHDSADVLKLLFDSPISRYINIQQFDVYARKSISNTCLAGHSAEPLRCLLEHGFSELFIPHVFFIAETRGREDIVDLLRPFIDKTHPPYSMQRAESLLEYLGVGSSYLKDGQMAMLQNLSPDEQRRTAKEFKNGLAQRQEKAEDQIFSSVLSQLQHQKV